MLYHSCDLCSDHWNRHFFLLKFNRLHRISWDIWYILDERKIYGAKWDDGVSSGENVKVLLSFSTFIILPFFFHGFGSTTSQWIAFKMIDWSWNGSCVKDRYFSRSCITIFLSLYPRCASALEYFESMLMNLGRKEKEFRNQKEVLSTVLIFF